MDENLVLEWQITGQETKMRREELIPTIFIVSLAIATGLAFQLREEFWQHFFLFSIIALAILLIFAICNRCIKYEDRSYRIDGQGLTVSKGSRQKEYNWSEFECFYKGSSAPGPEQNNKVSGVVNVISDSMKEYTPIIGETYLLRKKPKTVIERLFKTFIFVYSEPDNSQQVFEALSRYLVNKPKDVLTDSGLARYEFR